MTRRSSSVTIRDVAREAGVSVATVSRYINQTTPVSLEVAERLDKVMSELRYVPLAAARHLASRRTRVIGFVLNNLHNEFFVPLLNGMESVIRQRGYNLIVATNRANSRDTSPLPIGPHNTDGLLVFADGLEEDDLANFYESGFPIVLVYRASPSTLPIPSITVENLEISQKLVDHLINAHNRKRILFLRGPLNQEDSLHRENGYRNALQSNGIAINEDLILNGDFERDIAFQAMNNFLSNGRQIKFDAVFTGDDDAAIGVLRALKRSGFRVPEDIAVAGFDDLVFAPFLDPPLTTVRAPTETVGKLAAETLFALLENMPTGDSVVLPTEIIYRRSCGCEMEFENSPEKEMKSLTN